MGSRTCSPRADGSRVWTVLSLLCVVGTSVTASSCVLGNDNDRPVLAVDPLWDLTPGDRFVGDSCRNAGVVAMTWEIQDNRGKSLEKSDDLEPCKPLDFLGLTPGTYRLQLAGYDRDEEKLWESTCKGLELGRFDVLYTCDVDQIASGDDDASDAGVDGGESDAD